MKVVLIFCALLAVTSAWSLRSFTKVSNSAPLQITVFTESLCPDCQQFILGSFAEAIKADGIDKLANITIVPFGNARVNDLGYKYEFICQHGAKECLGNTIENCLLAHVESKTAQKVLVCFEDKIRSSDNWENVVAACGNEIGIDLSSLMSCANSKEGMMLTYQAAQRTDKNHQYVPWITVNGQHDATVEDQILENLVEYACSQYADSETIPACQNETLLDERNFVIDKNPIQIKAYITSTGSYSRSFIMNRFNDTINTPRMDKIVNFTLVPYGSAKETECSGQYLYECIGGVQDCYGNTLLNCVLDQYDQATAFKVTVCLMSFDRDLFDDDWRYPIQMCEKSVNTNLAKAVSCAKSELGNELTHKARLATDPAFIYEPLISINGFANYETSSYLDQNLLAYVCKSYKGDIEVEACDSYMRRKQRSYDDTFGVKP